LKDRREGTKRMEGRKVRDEVWTESVSGGVRGAKIGREVTE
jgi:hypothetical protein